MYSPLQTTLVPRDGDDDEEEEAADNDDSDGGLCDGFRCSNDCADAIDEVGGMMQL